jgi:hypothetical protein
MNTMQHFRWASLGMMLGLLVALAPGCAKKCGPDSCAGCCDATNACVTAVTDTACGVNGAACGACSATQSCQAGACVDKVVRPLEDAGTDAGVVDAGPPPCRLDLDCRALNNGSICDSSTGLCVPGEGCSQDYECKRPDEQHKCYESGRQCICDQHDGPDGGAPGTCRQRKGPCEECTSDRECGDDEIIFGPPEGLGAGKCAQLQGDTTGKKYCLYRRIGQCACGTVDDGTGYCKPQGNSCSQVGCNVDKDCSSGSVCSVNQPDAGTSTCGGICVPRCVWNFRTGSENSPGCPPGNSCWVDSANLDPTSSFFGSGRCKPPCQADTDCQASATNPFGGNNLKCASEKLVGGGSSPKRCRANGDCMDNEECPELPNDQPYLGYCDKASFSCKGDCRTGVDPLLLPYTDCRTPYTCARNAGANVCRLQTCMEQGGATLACASNQYCCGEDKNRDGTVDPCPPPGERNAVGCYDAPVPPFCTSCMNDDECANPAMPAWLSGANACRDGEKNPACSPLPNKCLYAGDRNPGSNDGINICAPATWNDQSALENSKNRARLGCPTGYTVTWVRPQLQQNSYCETNSDCNVGTDAGACEEDPELRQPDGGLGKSCRCTAGSARSQCPNADDGGVASECRSGPNGQRTTCIVSAVCMPRGSRVYQPTAEFGCGL